ncbi:MAG: phosphoglycolate phosphatase [Desulforhopalus sp.]|jgi:phosphoglycolate phosphatase
MLKLIVFDCDGVMFDSKQANVEYYNHLLQHFSLGLMDEEEEEYVHMGSVSDSIKHIFRKAPHIVREDIRAYQSELGYDPFLQYMKMESDLVEFLEITQKSYKLAISTNRSNTMIPLLEEHNLSNYFEKVVTALTAKRPKPAPDGLLEILDHFQCPPSEAIFIGDSIFDEQQASACQVDLIAFKSPNLNAKYRVNSFIEILSLEPFRD